MIIKTLTFALTLSFICLGQSVQQYFPADPGHKWFFQVTPLDSANRPVDSLSTVRIDSFAITAPYEGLNANFVVSKQGIHSGILLQPFRDTNYINLGSTDGNEYFRIPSVDSITHIFDLIGAGGSVTFLQTLKSFEKWYVLYKFSAAQNIPYSVFKYDTTLKIDTLTLPLRFELKGTRLSDKTVGTENGDFSCKRFFMTFSVNYLITIPPFPSIAIPLFSFDDTVSIAAANWIVQSVVPATTINLSTFGKGSYSIPGSMTSLIPEYTTGIERAKSPHQGTFTLYPAYPNPFNPSTMIKFDVLQAGLVSLTVHDMLGNQVAILLRNEYKTPGSYEYNFTATNLVSGVYIICLEAANLRLAQKILLIK